MMKIKPFLHRILLKMDGIEEVDETFKAIKAAGLVIPEKSKQQEQHAVCWGTVLEVGPTSFKEFGGTPSDLKIGDRVVIAKYAGKIIKVGSEEYTVVNDDDIVAVLVEGD